MIYMMDREFDKLTVIGTAPKQGKRLRYKCQCKCGAITIVTGEHLRSGHTKSCGCLVTKHGMWKTREHKTWQAMIERCTDKNHQAYLSYGGRGIKVCDSWLTFKAFYKDMGERPKGKTIERINNNKGYYKENCCWATPTEQARNRRLSKNNTSGFVGVKWVKQENKYYSYIGVNNKQIRLGCFVDINEAIAARKKGEEKYWNKGLAAL